jgi:capsular exopolysaccharide synthesis family protein
LLIELGSRKALTFNDTTEASPVGDEYNQTQYKLLASRTLAARTIDALKLWDHPEFGASGASNQGPARGAGAEAAKPPGQAKPTPTGDEFLNRLVVSPDTSRRALVVDAFLRRLVVSPIRNTRLVEVKFRSADPVVAANVANAHARAYIEQDLEARLDASSDLSKWLADQVAQQRLKVEESEAAVQKYREAHNALEVDGGQNIVDQKLSELSGAVTRAKMARIEKQTLHQQVKAVENDFDALSSLPVVLSNSYVQELKVQLAALQRQEAQLSEQLGVRHPDMIKVTAARDAASTKLRAAVAQIVKSLEADYRAAAAQESSLVQALEAQKQEALAINRTAIEGNVLKRDSESNRQLYDALLQRTKESGIVGELRPGNLRIVDRADVPRSPVSPKWGFSLLLALIGGPLLAVGLVFFLEVLHERITTPDEVLTHLGLPTLGLVPPVTTKVRGPQLLVGSSVPPVFMEAFRTVRTSVLMSPGGRGARSVLVTSSAPDEGKTMSATNLAAGLAQIGERVLLVDCDVRRPSLHLMFDLEQEPGLSDLLAGHARAKDVIRPSGVANLSVLPAGRVSPDAAELVGSKRFVELLAVLEGLYDRVVLDSSPVLAVADATILGRAAGGIVFVVSAEATGRKEVASAVTRLEEAGGQVIGVILNRVNLADQPGYYGDY